MTIETSSGFQPVDVRDLAAIHARLVTGAGVPGGWVCAGEFIPWSDLADLIDERGVRAIFTERLESTADADALAERLGVNVVPLVTDALTGDDDTDTYIEMMRSNATEMVTALTP